MSAVATSKPPFPSATLSRLTGYSDQAFSEQIEDLAQIDFADFDPSSGVTADNAYLLAASAALVYESEADQAAFLAAQPAVTNFRFLDSENNSDHPDTGTQVSLYETRDALIVSIRGTVFATDGPSWFDREWEDVINNMNAWPANSEDSAAWVHSGFKNAADGIWEQLEPLLEQAAQQGKSLHFTGHSLGAAIATHLADRTLQRLRQKPASLTTFGGPAVGWGGERDHLQNSGIAEQTVRFASSGDPTIWAVPGGRHAGPEAYFGRDRELSREEGAWNVLDRGLTHWDDMVGLRHPIEHHHPFNYCKLVAENREALDHWGP